MHFYACLVYATKCRLAVICVTNLLFSWTIVISRNNSEPFSSISDVDFVFICIYVKFYVFKMSYIDYVHVYNTLLVSKTKTFLKLRKQKTRNYAIYFLEIWVKILTHVKNPIRLYLIFQVIT